MSRPGEYHGRKHAPQSYYSVAQHGGPKALRRTARDNADRLTHRQEPIIRSYCFDPVQLPAHPSDRRNVPEPLRPDKRPDMVQVKPPAAPIPDVEPFGLT
jgi:hypothetical protein